MPSLLRSPFFALRLFSIVACAAACTSAGEDAASNSSDFTGTPVIEEGASFMVQSWGGGVATPGSECIPGSGFWRVNASKTMTAVTCEKTSDGSFIYQSRRFGEVGASSSNPGIDQGDFDAIQAAARAVTTSSKTTSSLDATDAPTLELLVDSKIDTSSKAYYDDHYASEVRAFAGSATTVQGLDALLGTLRRVADTFPLSPTAKATSKDGVPLWDNALTALDALEGGSGNAPAGSTCAPGARSYRIDRTRQWITYGICKETTEGSARLHFDFHQRHLSDTELGTVTDAIKSEKTMSTPQCDATKPFRRVSFTPARGYVFDEATSCREGVYADSVANLDALYAALGALAHD